jgi:hypothetical protein
MGSRLAGCYTRPKGMTPFVRPERQKAGFFSGDRPDKYILEILLSCQKCPLIRQSIIQKFGI